MSLEFDTTNEVGAGCQGLLRILWKLIRPRARHVILLVILVTPPDSPETLENFKVTKK